jgi:hypothetical protein
MSLSWLGATSLKYVQTTEDLRIESSWTKSYVFYQASSYKITRSILHIFIISYLSLALSTMLAHKDLFHSPHPQRGSLGYIYRLPPRGNMVAKHKGGCKIGIKTTKTQATRLILTHNTKAGYYL